MYLSCWDFSPILYHSGDMPKIIEIYGLLFIHLLSLFFGQCEAIMLILFSPMRLEK